MAPLTVVRYDLEGLDPYRNLAAEEMLARTCPEGTARLVFSCNRPVVVLGRNQNPWVEADLAEVTREGLALARRASGGGTVVHDPGNLNYGLAVPRPRYDPDRILGLVVQALTSLGVPAEACARHSIWVAGRKISGTAFLLTGRMALLHGCILIDSDLNRLRRALRVSPADRRTHAVASVRSPVTRLRDIRPELSLAAVREAIAGAVSAHFGGGCRRESLAAVMPAEALAAQAERLASWEWVYGRTPDFEHVLDVAPVPVVLRIQGARVTEVEAGTATTALRAALGRLPYDGERLAEVAAQVPGLGPAERAALAEALRREVPPMAGQDPPPSRPPAAG